jgi:hypothetical protein
MPTNTISKLKTFLEAIFYDINNTKQEEKKIKINEYDKFAYVYFGSNYRTLQDYRKAMIVQGIITSFNGVEVVFNKKAYFDFLELVDQKDRLERGLLGK